MRMRLKINSALGFSDKSWGVLLPISSIVGRCLVSVAAFKRYHALELSLFQGRRFRPFLAKVTLELGHTDLD